jgi:two-component system chemotaxis sensor kinase CheA
MISEMAQYLSVFLDEGREQLGLLETHILSLERGDSSTEILQVLFRAAHTLKGSSRAMGFLAIGDLTHEMENVLDDLRQGKMTVGTEIVNALLSCLDALSGLIDTVEQTSTDTAAAGSADIPALVARLSALRSSAGVPVPPVVSSAAPSDSVLMTLQEHVQASLQQAHDAGLTAYHITVTLDPACLMKSVRVFMVLAALEPLGSVLASVPEEEALDNEEFDKEFQLLFVTEGRSEAISAALSEISELAAVSVTPWVADAPPASVTPPASASASAEASVPDAPVGTASPAVSHAAARTQTIRVDIGRLDNLLNLIGELVIDRTQIARLAGELQSRYPQDEGASSLIEAVHRIARITGELQDQIMQTRMLPIDGVFQRLPRMVRDLAQKTGKELDFQMEGGETELDRSVLEALGDPLIHLLRNSVDHGIELPEARQTAGKPALGKVILAARQVANQIVITLTDDGAGIHPAKIKASAVSKGLITQSAADAMSDKDAIALIFASGLSTAAVISDISGRGVGMDIVKSNLEKLGGRLSVDSEVGRGTCFTIHLPLTLAIVRALLVSAGGGTYVLPLSAVVEMLRLGTEEGEIPLRTVGGQAVMVLRGRTVPLISLSGVLSGDPRATRASGIPADAYVVVVGFGDTQVGLCVDGLLGEQEVVIKSIGILLGDIPGLAGATILGDGSVALIVDVAKAVETIRAATAAPRPALVGV